MSSQHIYANDTPVLQLNAEKAFNGLSNGEQLYAHYLSKSSWIGSLVVLFQTSPESPLIFALLRQLLRYQSLDELQELAKTSANFDDNEWRSLLVYFSAFLTNMGNYRGMGDTKFVPNVSPNQLEALVVNSKAFKANETDVKFIWDNVKDSMFSLDKNRLSLGFPPNGISTFFSKNFTENDSKIVKQFMEMNNILPRNTRAFKDSETNTYEIRFASMLTNEDTEDCDYLQLKGSNDMNGEKFVLSRGDYSSLLKILNNYLMEAKNNARNETQIQMIGQYIRHFTTGDVNGHKEGSRLWIKDKGPTVEAYLGFIYQYRDPAGMRGQWLGYVSMVNKEMSKSFESLVANSVSLLPLLPWPEAFEKDRFLQPDFTSLDVLSLTGGNIFSGYNSPEYEDIALNEGFKNVSFGNIIIARMNDLKYEFLSAEDLILMKKYHIKAFEVQVGLHELLGHGSGKLFKCEDQKLNFNDNTVNPLTNQKVDNWYKLGQTYDSVFAALGGPLEECRAECVGLYLSLESLVLKIFGFTGAEAEDVVYVNWLSLIYLGINSLEMYNPVLNKWLQAHSQARYVMTRVLIESCKGLVSIEYIEKSTIDGKPDLLISLKKDNHLLQTVGKKAIGDFLLKLQVYKSMADVESAHRLFDPYSQVSDDLEYPYLTFRDIVLDRKKPKNLFVQSSTHVVDDKVVLTSYPATHEGLIQSFGAHFSGHSDLEDIVMDLWRKDCKHFV